MELCLGGFGAATAVFFTNPLEVIKTRFQLQGELQARGRGLYSVHYRNIIHAAVQIVKHEGLFSMQKGLSPAIGYQLTVNGPRLGIYQTFNNQVLLTYVLSLCSLLLSHFFG